MILNYKQFLLEKFYPQATDSPDMVSRMNSLNQIEDDIKEFNSNKSKLLNIYLNYKDHNDLISKLKSNKYIGQQAKPNTIEFNNRLLSLWATSCKKRRKIKNLEDEMKGFEAGSDSIKDTTDKINDLKREILDDEKAVNDKLKEMKDDLIDSSKKVNFYLSNK